MPVDRVRARPVSLALRLIAFIGLSISLIFLGFGWLIERAIEQHFAQQDAEELEVISASIQHVLKSTPVGSTHLQLASNLAGAVQGHHGMYYLVADAHGHVLYTTPGPDLGAALRQLPLSTHLDAGTLTVWSDHGQTYRGAALHLSGGDVQQGTSAGPGVYTAVVAADMGFHDHFLVHFHHTLWGGTSVAVLLVILVTWFAVHRGHAPLREVSARIRGISANQLHVRLDPRTVPIELADLAVSFNTMIERVEQDFRQLSHFSADIAHELRTPVTNLVTQTQVVLSKARTLDEYKEVLYSNLEEYERMAKMIGDMLYLAQTDNQLIKPERLPVDLMAEVQALFDYFEPLADERGIRLTMQGACPPVPGDRLMLRRALSNVLSNAIRHTPNGQTVVVQLDRDDADVRVRILNPGDTIEAEHLPHLFDRFYRADPSRQHQGDGAGLGLAIVKSIMDLHGGGITVQSAAGQTCFEMRLNG